MERKYVKFLSFIYSRVHSSAGKLSVLVFRKRIIILSTVVGDETLDCYQFVHKMKLMIVMIRATM